MLATLFQVYVRDATTISPYALLLFGGALKVDHERRRIVVDDWLSIDAPPRTAVLVKQVPVNIVRLMSKSLGMTNVVLDLCVSSGTT